MKNMTFEQGSEGDQEMNVQTAIGKFSYVFTCQLYALQISSPTLWLAFSLSLRYSLMKDVLIFNIV